MVKYKKTFSFMFTFVFVFGLLLILTLPSVQAEADGELVMARQVEARFLDPNLQTLNSVFERHRSNNGNRNCKCWWVGSRWRTVPGLVLIAQATHRSTRQRSFEDITG